MGNLTVPLVQRKAEAKKKKVTKYKVVGREKEAAGLKKWCTGPTSFGPREKKELHRVCIG